MSRSDRLRTFLALGLSNLARVGLYRVGLRSGMHPSQRIAASAPTAPFFVPPPAGIAPAEPRQDWQPGHATIFGRDVTRPGPDGTWDWFTSTLTGASAASDRLWWRIPDFDKDVGDIKAVWEASRFDWVLAFAQRAAAGSTSDLDRLNATLADWSRANPPYLGANWKCGQEASIRVMHLAAAARILGQDTEPPAGVRALIAVHLRRIAPTIGYAIGQANNHGTSEAAALFIGGTLAGQAGPARTGRRWLENRARVLIEPDGSFSQYSVTYHRVMLDSYALAEIWRRRYGLPAFSDTLYGRMRRATDWLEQMTDPDTGDAPVLGANDGAHLIDMTGLGYRDFRPSVQLASALFRQTRAYPSGPWDRQAQWLGTDLPEVTATAPVSASFDKGGFHVLRAQRARAYLRYPRFRFRPSQADALHLDLWADGRNLLRDAGSFSYNVSEADTAYFNGTRAHNTVQFDDRDQMPRLGRFLFGSWLTATDVATVAHVDEAVSAAAGYTDRWGARHVRNVSLHPDRAVVTDRISGFVPPAALRWRLIPGDYRIENDTVIGADLRLRVSADDQVPEIALTGGWESRYYLEKTPLPVVEIHVHGPCTLRTEIQF